MQRKSSNLPYEPQEQLFNKQSHTHLRRKLRKNPTEPERRLWAKLRNRQLGVKFRRQQGIGNYIVDFYCAERALVIELDGDSHFTLTGIACDEARDNYIKAIGFRILRFANTDIIQNMDAVIEAIAEHLEMDATTDMSKKKSAQY